MSKRVLITGVAGMIGSHLVDDLLNKDYYVVGIDNLSFGKIDNISVNFNNPRFKFYHVDVLDFDTLKILCKDIDIIVHLAAVKKISESDSSMKTLLVNGKGSEHVFEAAKMWGCKVIFASTSDVYGMSNELPHSEDSDLLLGPSMIKRWSYAVSKLYNEQMAFSYYKDYGLPIVVLRYFGAFSSRANFAWSGGHIPMFIDRVLKDDEVVVHGDGAQTRSMGYVTDLIDGTILALENDKAVGEIINLGNDEEMSVLESAHLISKVAKTGKKLKIKLVPFKEIFGEYKDIMRRKPNLAKAERILGYTPKVKMEDAIVRTVNERKKQLGITC